MPRPMHLTGLVLTLAMATHTTARAAQPIQHTIESLRSELKTMATPSTVWAMMKHARTGGPGVSVDRFSETKPMTVRIRGDAFANMGALLHDARAAQRAWREKVFGSKTVTRQLRRMVDRSDVIRVNESAHTVEGWDHARNAIRTVLVNGTVTTRPLGVGAQVTRRPPLETTIGSRVSSEYRLGRNTNAMRAEAARQGASGPAPRRGDRVSITTYQDGRTLVYGHGAAGTWKFWR